jgi:hypothetical protein
VARKPFHDKCNIKKPTKNKAFSLNLATFGLVPAEAKLAATKRSASLFLFSFFRPLGGRKRKGILANLR